MTGPLLIVIAAILWALDGLLRRSLYSLPPLTIVFLEHLVGLVLLIPWMPKVAAEVKNWSFKQWGWISWVALFSGVLGTLWFTTALLSVQYIPFSVAFLLQKVQPVFVFLTAMLLLGERPSLKRFAWSALALVAAYFVTFPLGKVNFETGAGTVVAAGYALAAAFAWGTGTIFSRLSLQSQSSTAALTVRFGVATVVAAVMLWLMPGANKVMAVTPAQMGSLFMIALSTGMVGLAIYYKGLAKTAPTVATILELVFPLLAVLIDAKVYGVVLHPTQYLAALVLMVAGFMVARTGKNGLPITFSSVKVSGDGRGKTLGFPTINLQIPWNLVLTPGIYAVWIWIDGEKYAGAMHYGSVPTFDKIEQTLEVFVLTKKALPNAQIQKADLKVTVVEKLREVMKFESSKDLVKQMERDVVQTKQLLLD